MHVLSFAGREIPSSILDAEVEADWGPVYLIGLQRPIGLEPIKQRPNLQYIKAGRALGALVAYNGGWSAEVLVDALAGLVDVVEVCNNLFHRHKYAPRSQYSNLLAATELPQYANSPEEMLRLNCESYYRLLNCGLRLAAGAGSAAGVKTTPAGYNRAYVRAGANPNLQQFLAAWREGRNFVTNGPMLFLTVDGKHEPGATIAFGARGGSLRVRANALSDQPLRSLEIVANGRVVGQAKTGQNGSAEIDLPLAIREGTWITARATDEDRFLSDEELKVYRRERGVWGEEPARLRFAHTSPVYVTVAGALPRVERSLAEARRMLAAFERFAGERVRPEDRAELDEVLVAARARIAATTPAVEN